MPIAVLVSVSQNMGYQMEFPLNLRNNAGLPRKSHPALRHGVCRLLRRTLLFAGVVLIAAMAGTMLNQAAHAEAFSAEFEVKYMDPRGGREKVFRAHLTSRCVGSAVVYKLRNLGERWPSRANLAFFRGGENAPMIFKDIVLERGQTVTFRIYTDRRYPTIDMRIKAGWLGQTVFHRSQHKPHGAQLSQSRPQSKKTFKRHLAYVLPR